MNKYFKYLIVIALLINFSCEEDNGIGESSDYVTFESTDLGFQVNANSTDQRDIIVYTGNKKSSDRTFNVMVDPSSTLTANYNVPSSVTIPGGSNVGVLTISVTDDDTLSFDAQSLIIGFEDGTGTSVGDPVTLSVAELCPGDLVQFRLTLDTWPDETTWEIYDLNGTTPTVIASGGPYINPDDDFAALVFEYCLLPGDYGVVVYDSYGDGGPMYSVTSNAGGTLVAETTVGGSQSSATFTVN